MFWLWLWLPPPPQLTNCLVSKPCTSIRLAAVVGDLGCLTSIGISLKVKFEGGRRGPRSRNVLGSSKELSCSGPCGYVVEISKIENRIKPSTGAH